MEYDFSDYKESDPFYVQAILLAEVVKRILSQKAEIVLTAKPVIKSVPIIEFMKKMRIWSLDKFRNTAFVSVVNFYLSNIDREKHRAIGAIILYIDEEYIIQLFKKLGYPKLDDEDVDALKDACGTFCNLIAAKFKSGLIQLGYEELVMSHFTSYLNEVGPGVEYDNTRKHKYEISFEIKGMKRLVVDLTMGSIPRIKSD